MLSVKLDPILEELIDKASQNFEVPKKLLIDIITEEKLQRYRRQGDRSLLEKRLLDLLSGSDPE